MNYGLNRPFTIRIGRDTDEKIYFDLASRTYSRFLKALQEKRPLKPLRQALFENDKFLRAVIEFELANYYASIDYISTFDRGREFLAKNVHETMSAKSVCGEVNRALAILRKAGVLDRLLEIAIESRVADFERPSSSFRKSRAKEKLPIYSGGRLIELEDRAKAQTLPLYWTLFRIREISSVSLGGSTGVAKAVTLLPRLMDEKSVTPSAESLSRNLSRNFSTVRARESLISDYRSILDSLSQFESCVCFRNFKTILT